MSGCDELLGDLVAKARQGARGETDARELGEKEKQMRLTTRSKVVAVAAIVGLIGSGAAYAYWTTTGSGTGSATTGTNSPVIVNQTSTITGMYPGQAAQPLSGDFTNPNDGPAYVTAVTAAGYTIDAAHLTDGCLADGNYTLGGTALVGAEVPAGTNVGAWSGLTIRMDNLGTNQDACKDAIVTITYASS